MDHKVVEDDKALISSYPDRTLLVKKGFIIY